MVRSLSPPFQPDVLETAPEHGSHIFHEIPTYPDRRQKVSSACLIRINLNSWRSSTLRTGSVAWGNGPTNKGMKC